MSVRSIVVRAGAVLLVLAVIFAALNFWPATEGPRTESGELWTCSMHPQIRLPKPGQCPICGMNLVPVSQISAERGRLDEQAGIEAAEVKPREVWKEVRTVGRIDYNERRVAFIAARIAGRVDRVYADFTGLEVKQGDHLVDIYSPDLYTAQRELLLALESFEKEKKAGTEHTASELLLDAVRAKLGLWGILPEQIREFEETKKPRTHVTIYAPIGGVVIEKGIREGQYVKDGDMLYRIAQLDPIWLYLNIYEYDLASIRRGQKVDVTVEAFPGETFAGTVAFIDPFLDDPTRTVRIRVNLKNPGPRLKPAMYASAAVRVPILPDGRPAPTGLEGKYTCPMHPEVVQDAPGKCPLCGMALERIPAEPAPSAPAPVAHDSHAGHAGHEGTVVATTRVLAIPVSAVLDTGRRRVAYRRTKEGALRPGSGQAYELVELTLGPRVEGLDDAGKRASYFAVTAGLEPGDSVIVRGGFLLDSQRQLEGMPSLFFPEGRTGTQLHSGHGSHGGQ